MEHWSDYYYPTLPGNDQGYNKFIKSPVVYRILNYNNY